MVVVNQLTESLPVMPDSIVTVIRCRYGDGDHLPLRTRQLRSAEQQLPVESKMGEHHSWLKAVNAENVSNLAARAGDFVECGLELSGRAFTINRVDVCHAGTPCHQPRDGQQQSFRYVLARTRTASLSAPCAFHRRAAHSRSIDGSESRSPNRFSSSALRPGGACEKPAVECSCLRQDRRATRAVDCGGSPTSEIRPNPGLRLASLGLPHGYSLSRLRRDATAQPFLRPGADFNGLGATRASPLRLIEALVATRR